MWQISSSIFEIIVRAICIYSAVFIIFRFIGKKQLGQMSPFDFVLLLIISESVSNGLGGEEHSIGGAVISAFTLIGMSSLIDYLTFRFKKVEAWVEGEPQFIIKNGSICEEIRVKEKITFEEI